MEPNTLATAIISGIVSGAAGRVTEAIGQQTVAAYRVLKQTICDRFGANSEFVKAINQLEAKPDSKGWREEVGDEIVKQQAVNDPAIVQAAQNLLETLSASSIGEQHIQTAIGNNIAQADSNGRATVNVYKPK